MITVNEGPFEWTNEHGTYKQQIKDLYHLRNIPGASIDVYNDTTKGIQGIIADAIKNSTPVRAVGGNWSLSPITATSGIILNTQYLNLIFPIGTGNLHPEFKGDNNNLFFAQCGTAIWELSKRLHESGRSLPASGASNGQTIAGAIATGTHGAGVSFGAHQEAVVALHIITGPDTSIWLERNSKPVMSDKFAEMLNATPVREDDEAFNAAVVSFGAFGFVHGVMVQAEPDYLLESYLKRVPYDTAFKQQVTALDFNYDKLPYPGEVPFHFGTLINPYDLDKGVYMTVMYKRPYRDHEPPKANGEGIGPGDDAPCFIGKLSDVLPAAVPLLANTVIGGSLTPYDKKEGTLAEIFSNTLLRGKVASAAIGFSPVHAVAVMDMLMKINKTSGPFVGVFAFRFVKSSKATMAFTRFAPVTCVLELDGVQSKRTLSFYNAVWVELGKMGVKFTFHWGKMNTLTADMIKDMYGDSVGKFLAQRNKYVDAATVRILSNDTLNSWGFGAPLPPLPTVPPSPMIV